MGTIVNMMLSSQEMTYQDALDLNSALQELKVDPVANNYYKLKLACINAIVKLKPIVAQINELNAPAERYLEYQQRRTELFERYAERGSNGEVIYYKDMACSQRLLSGEQVSVVFYNFKEKVDEVEKQGRLLMEEYSDAIAAEQDRIPTKERLLASQLPNDVSFISAGTDYPEHLPMKFMLPLLVCGIITEKEV